MEGLLYFAFGALSVGLLFLLTNIYRRETGVDLFPGRRDGNTIDMFLNIIAYILCGPFGTIVIVLLGVVLFYVWKKYYRKNKK